MTTARSMPRQPEVNIGLVGHVDHGKTTLTQALSGQWTDTHSEERRRGISIKLGYADTAFYKTEDGRFYTPGKHPDGMEDRPGELQRVVSFVDSPGHETLMAIMITGTSIMDGAMLLIAANERCPQPQTREHLTALQIAGIRNIVIVQNKVDIVSEERARESYEEIKAFVAGTVAEEAPIIPVSAHHDVNLDILIEKIEERIPTPERTSSGTPLMYVARSFDINRPGARPAEITGGVIGGSVVDGTFTAEDEIEIAPGRRVGSGNNMRWETLTTRITGLRGGGRWLDSMNAGGLCGMATPLDPALTKSDNLSGQVVARKGELPPVRHEVDIKITIVESMVGESDAAVRPLQTNEMLMVNVATATSVGVVTSHERGKASLRLRLPICAPAGARIALSRRVGQRWRLVGYGTII